MIQDLTANSDFLKHRDFSDVLDRLLTTDLEAAYEVLVPSDREIVLTGTTFERERKRYALEHEINWENMCDCCGAPIKNKPWDFRNNSSLCTDCEQSLRYEISDLMNGDESVSEIFDDSSMINVMKPWDLAEHERENPIDNVLLWD